MILIFFRTVYALAFLFFKLYNKGRCPIQKRKGRMHDEGAGSK